MMRRIDEGFQNAFAEQGAQLAFNAQAKMGDGHIVRSPFEGILGAFSDLVERNVHPGDEPTERHAKPSHTSALVRATDQ